MDKVLYKIDGKLTDNVNAVIAYMRRNKLTQLTDLVYLGEEFEQVEDEAPALAQFPVEEKEAPKKSKKKK